MQIGNFVRKYKFRIDRFTLTEISLLLFLYGSSLAIGNWFDTNKIVFVYIIAYILPVSTFGNNLSNLPFLIAWILGILGVGAKFDWFFSKGLFFTVVLYLVFKIRFVSKYQKDLVLGSSSGFRFSNNWYSSVSKSDSSLGDTRDMNHQMIMIGIAIFSLLMGFVI